MEKVGGLRLNVRNSDLNIPKDKRAFLTFVEEGLVPCVLEEVEDGVWFEFEAEGLVPSEILSAERWLEQLRFLINCADLEKLHQEYSFSLSPKNLMIDINLRPHVLLRDMLGNRVSFLAKYKALIGSIIQSRYTYDDYIDGGRGLYHKNKLLAELSEFDTVNDIKTRLTEIHHLEYKTQKSEKQMVSNKSVQLCRISIPLLIIVMVVASFFAIRSTFFEIPRKDRLIEANAAYIAGNYLDVPWILADMPIESFDYATKYYLSRSYVIAEALTDNQRMNVLTGLTLLTDPAIFDYWILLGRLEVDAAVELAQRVGDNELLLFAYMKYHVVVQANTTMQGDEKVALLDELERQINNLLNARDQASEAEEAAETYDSSP